MQVISQDDNLKYKKTSNNINLRIKGKINIIY